MDQGTLVEEKIDDGRRFVERFAADGNPVQAAFWVKTAEEGIWFLYVTTDIFDRDGPAALVTARAWWVSTWLVGLRAVGGGVPGVPRRAVAGRVARGGRQAGVPARALPGQRPYRTVPR